MVIKIKIIRDDGEEVFPDNFKDHNDAIQYLNDDWSQQMDCEEALKNKII